MPIEGEVTCHDAVFGDVTFDYKLLMTLFCSSPMAGQPYHLAAMVDDHDMGISHVHAW